MDAQEIVPAPEHVLREPGPGVALVQVLALGAAAAVVVLTSGTDHWRVSPLVVLALFTIASDLTCVDVGSTKLRMSSSLLGIMLATVLLGGGPGALIGVLTIAGGWFRSREPLHVFRNNLATFAWFPLVSGLFFYAAVHMAHTGPQQLAYYLLVFAAFIVALTLDFLPVAGYQCYLDGSSLIDKTREALVPLLASELFSALLTMGAVY